MEIGMVFIMASIILASIAALHDLAPSITGFAVYEEEEEPNPAAGTIQRGIAEMAMEGNIRPGNEPYFVYKGKGTTVLLLHGLTASPWEMQAIADYLADRNITVYAPLLAGHGRTPEILGKTEWEDWYDSAEKALAQLEEYSDNVYVIGISTGADIAALLAKNHPEIKGIILASPAIYFRDWKAKYVWLFKYFIKYVETSSLSPEEEPFYYSVKPVASVDQLRKLAKQVRKSLPGISTPVLVMQSMQDPTADPEGAAYMFENIASEKKEIIRYDRGGHVIVRDPEIMIAVFRDAYGFIAENQE